MGAATMRGATMAVALLLLAVYTASAIADTGDQLGTDTIVPESDFVEYDFSKPLSKAAEAKQNKLVKASDKVMKAKISVPEVPKGEPAHEKKAQKEEGTMATKAGKKLDKTAHGKIVTAESVRLQKDHEGSLDPNSPWNKAEAKTHHAVKAARKRVRNSLHAQQQHADNIKWAKEVVKQRAARDKKFKAAVARQDAWDRAEQQKVDAERAREAKIRSEAKYNNIVGKEWIQRLKKSKDPALREAGKEAEEAMKARKIEARKEAEEARNKPHLKQHTNKPPTPPLPNVTPEAAAMSAATGSFAKNAAKNYNNDVKKVTHEDVKKIKKAKAEEKVVYKKELKKALSKDKKDLKKK